MAEPQVNIRITTTGDTSGAQAVGRSLDALEQEARQLTQQMRQLATDSDAFNETRTRLNGLNEEIRQLRTGQTGAASSASNFGQAMLQGSRGIQDFSAAGLNGVINNLEGLATALGLTAGAAGGITLVAVGLDLLIKNWDKVKGVFGSADEARAFWSAMTPEESYTARLREAAEAQERIAAAIERTAEQRVKALEAQQKEFEWLEKQKKQWEEVLPKDENELPPLPGMGGPSAAMVKAATEQAQAEAVYQASLQQVGRTDAAVKAKEKEIQDTQMREAIQRQLEAQLAADREEELNLPSGPERNAQMTAIRERMAQRQIDAQQRMQGLGTVPLKGPLTGDPEQDQKTMQESLQAAREELARLRSERFSAAETAERERLNLAGAEQTTRQTAAGEREASAIQAVKEGGFLPLPGQFAGADAAMGISPIAQQQAEAVRTAIQQATQTLQSNGAAIEQGLSEVNRGLAGNMSTLVREIAALKSTVQSQAAEIENLRANAR